MSVSRAVRRLTAPSAIVVVPTPSEAIMEALQITGVITLACVATMALFYGEILLLQHT